MRRQAEQSTQSTNTLRWLTPAPRVHLRVVLVVQVGLIQISKGLELHFSILEKA